MSWVETVPTDNETLTEILKAIMVHDSIIRIFFSEREMPIKCVNHVRWDLSGGSCLFYLITADVYCILYIV